MGAGAGRIGDEGGGEAVVGRKAIGVETTGSQLEKALLVVNRMFEGPRVARRACIGGVRDGAVAVEFSVVGGASRPGRGNGRSDDSAGAKVHECLRPWSKSAPGGIITTKIVKRRATVVTYSSTGV